jgi:hypothetical protein
LSLTEQKSAIWTRVVSVRRYRYAPVPRLSNVKHPMCDV